jgi:hypothetical protein
MAMDVRLYKETVMKNITSIKERLLTEVFDDKESAQKAYDDAIHLGFQPSEINVLLSEKSRKKFFEKMGGDKSMEGLAMGGALGGAIVGTLAAIIGVGLTFTLPGLGLIISGPLAAGLVGLGAGSISGGIVGALVGWGIPQDKALYYEKRIKSGGIVLAVKGTPTQLTHLKTKWRKYRSHHHDKAA